MSEKRVKSIRLIQIEAFLRVVERQSFTKAAEELNLHQGTVSKYVDELGDLLGAPLLHSGTATPSAAGSVLLPVAEEIMRAIEKGRGQISALLEKRPRRIRAEDLRLK